MTTFLVLNVFVAIIVDNFEQEIKKDDESMSTVTLSDLTAFRDLWSKWRGMQVAAMWSNKDKMMLVRQLESLGTSGGYPEEVIRNAIQRACGNYVYQGQIDYDCRAMTEPEYESRLHCLRPHTVPLSQQPCWMHVSQLGVFLNNAPKPLGFRDNPLDTSALLRLLIGLNIRQVEGYVHYAELLLALVQGVYGTEVLSIPSQNEQYRLNKAQLKAIHPELSLLKGCEYGAGHYMCILFIQRGVRRFLRRKRAEREREREMNEQDAVVV